MYVGQTVQNIEKYRGSGPYWKSHCKKNGGYSVDNIEVIWKEFFLEKEKAQQFLDTFMNEEGEYWLSENTKWANDVPETTDDSNFTSTSKLIQADLIARGMHHLLSGDIQSRENAKRVQNGTHNFQDPKHIEKLKDVNKKLIVEGRHVLQDLELKRKVNEARVQNGTHNFLGITCRNKKGEVVSITKEVYYMQVGEMKDWEYVAVQSKEAKKRKNLL